MIRRWEGFWHRIITFHLHHLISFKSLAMIVHVLRSFVLTFDLEIGLDAFSVFGLQLLHVLLTKPWICTFRTESSFFITLLILNMYLLLQHFILLYLTLQAQFAIVFANLRSEFNLSVAHERAICLLMLNIIPTEVYALLALWNWWCCAASFTYILDFCLILGDVLSFRNWDHWVFQSRINDSSIELGWLATYEVFLWTIWKLIWMSLHVLLLVLYNIRFTILEHATILLCLMELLLLSWPIIGAYVLIALLLLTKNDFVQLLLPMWYLTHLIGIGALWKGSLCCNQWFLRVYCDVIPIFRYWLRITIIMCLITWLLITSYAAEVIWSVWMHLILLKLIQVATIAIFVYSVLIDGIDNIRLNINISYTWTLILGGIFLDIQVLTIVNI